MAVRAASEDGGVAGRFGYCAVHGGLGYVHNFGQYTAGRTSVQRGEVEGNAFDGLDHFHEYRARSKPADFLPAFVSINFPSGGVNGGLIKEGALSSGAAPLTVEMKEGTTLRFCCRRRREPV